MYRLVKGGAFVELDNPIHVDAYKANGWVESHETEARPAEPVASEEEKESKPKAPKKTRKK